MRLLHVFRHRNFAIYSAGSAASLIGTWMQRITVGWLTWELTGSGAWLGLIAFADLFPTVVIGLFAGAAADRWNRLRIAQVGQLLGMLQASALLFVYLSGHLTMVVLFAFTLFNGSVAAVNQPARLALIHTLVGRDQLSAAVAVNAVVFNLARFIGPAIGGVLVASAGAGWTFALNAASFGAFLWALLRIDVQAAALPMIRKPFFADIAEGVQYAAQHPGIGPIFLLMIAAGVGARPLVELLPGFAGNVFSSGPIGLAALTSAIAVGAILGGVWVGNRPKHGGLTLIVAISSLGMATTGVVFTMMDSIESGVATLVFTGFFMAIMGIGTQTLVQLAADDNKRGRVLSLHGLVFRGGPAVGALIMGAFSEIAGLRLSVALGCVAVIICGFAVLTQLKGIIASLEPDEIRCETPAQQAASSRLPRH